MNYFSIAFARGVADELVDNGLIKVSSEQGLLKLAQITDGIGSSINLDVSDFNNLPNDVGYEVAHAIMTKVSEGSLHTGDKPSHENSAENAADQVKGTAAMDQEERPQGSYLAGVGKTEVDTPSGHVGEQEEHKKSPKDEEKSNSTIEDREKSAAVQAILRKLSGDTGSLHTGEKPSQDNSPENAAVQVGGLAAMDYEERPQGSYLTGVGKTEVDARKGHVGKEEIHKKSPMDEEKVNSPIEERAKSAGINPRYLQAFENTASYVLPKIACALNDSDKIAIVQRCMDMTPVKIASFIENFNKEANKVKHLAGKAKGLGKSVAGKFKNRGTTADPTPGQEVALAAGMHGAGALGAAGIGLGAYSLLRPEPEPDPTFLESLRERVGL